MTIAERVSLIREKVALCAQACGRNASSVQLMAVTKGVPAEMVQQAYDVGIRIFGENRVQEAMQKFPVALEGASLHMIGHLQKNKAGKAAYLFDCIQSVDALSTAKVLSSHAERRETSMDIMLELRTGEDSKSGYQSEEVLMDEIELIAQLPHIRVCGLMTLAPFTKEKRKIAQAFRRLANLFEDMRSLYPQLHCLSMGMSNDYELAIAEGATMIRIGSALFKDAHE